MPTNIKYSCKQCGDIHTTEIKAKVCCGEWKCGWCGTQWYEYDDVEGCCNEGISPASVFD